MDGEIRQYKNKIRKEVKQSEQYRKLMRRNFRKHKGYINYSAVACDLAMVLATLNLRSLMITRQNDPTWVNCLGCFYGLYHVDSFPVYAISPELFEDFLNSDPPGELYGVPQPFKNALLLFPSGRIKNPDGLSLNWVAIDYINPDEKEQEKHLFDYIKQITGVNASWKYNSFGKATNHLPKIRWCSNLDTEHLYSSCTVIPHPDSPIPRQSGFNADREDYEIDKERYFTTVVTGIVFQFLVYLVSSRGDIPQSVPLSPDVLRRNKHKKRIDPNPERDFIWVGKNYKTKMIRRSHQGGSHNSPIGHVRRGHYRTLPWREAGSQEVWVRPAYVGGKDAAR